MPIPDQVYFGEKPEGGGIHYGEVRKEVTKNISDERKIKLLKARLDTLLIKQINSLSLLNNTSDENKWSPFPLQIISLVAIEALGRTIGDFQKIDGEAGYSKKLSLPIYYLMDNELKRTPSKKFKTSFKEITSYKEVPINYADVIHTYQRNTFNHGYQAKGVFIDHSIESFWQLYEENGYISVNPFLFWNRLLDIYEKIFSEMLTIRKPNLLYRNHALNFFNHLIS